MVARGFARRGDIYLIGLDPTLGSEIKKTRPCLVVSPDELNEHLRTTIVAALTEWAAAEPGRVDGDPAEWAARAAPVVLGLGPGFLVQRTIIEGFDEDDYLRMLPGMLPH